MSETQKKPLTLKGILALAGAGLLYVIAQLTGIDLPGTGEAQAGGSSSNATETSSDSKTELGSASEAPKTETKPEKKADPKPEPEAPKANLRDDTAEIQKLFKAMRSDVQVEAEGEVVHLLPDDTRGSQHQLFLCELSNGLTLKISHNIDIAPYIHELRKGDRVRFHGEYEWNEKGGVVHWTHRNTRGGSHPGGWIIHEGKKYE